MARPSAIFSYVLDQAHELLRELGFEGLSESLEGGAARDVLVVLHDRVKDTSLSEEVRDLLRAEAKLVAGRLEDAKSTLFELIDDSGTPVDIRGLAFDRLGDIAWWDADFKSAAELYQESIQLRPDDNRTRKDLARAKWHLGEAALTEESFGGDAVSSVEAPAGKVVFEESESGVIEVHGLYVGAGGSGVMALQGCLEDETVGMVATGSLGTMAQEACDLAWAIWRRSGAHESHGVRVHAPQAGVLKDGPSLGLAVYALFGAVLGQIHPVVGDAFTGEIDLKGNVLPIGGAHEKALAAYLTGFRRLFLPLANLSEVKEGFSDTLDIRPISHIDQLEDALR